MAEQQLEEQLDVGLEAATGPHCTAENRWSKYVQITKCLSAVAGGGGGSGHMVVGLRSSLKNSTKFDVIWRKSMNLNSIQTINMIFIKSPVLSQVLLSIVSISK